MSFVFDAGNASGGRLQGGGCDAVDRASNAVVTGRKGGWMGGDCSLHLC
jgi:hypothetical protein